MSEMIPVTEVKLTLLDGASATKALGSVTLAGSFVVHGIRVVQSQNGLFVAMPQRKDGEAFRDLAHPITGPMRALLSSKVLEEYQRLQELDRGMER